MLLLVSCSLVSGADNTADRVFRAGELTWTRGVAEFQNALLDEETWEVRFHWEMASWLVLHPILRESRFRLYAHEGDYEFSPDFTFGGGGGVSLPLAWRSWSLAPTAWAVYLPLSASITTDQERRDWGAYRLQFLDTGVGVAVAYRVRLFGFSLLYRQRWFYGRYFSGSESADYFLDASNPPEYGMQFFYHFPQPGARGLSLGLRFLENGKNPREHAALSIILKKELW